MNVLVVNAGSSSLKYQLFDTANDTVYAKGICERIGTDGSLIEHKQLVKGLKIEEAHPMKTHADAMKIVVEKLLDKEYGCISSMSEIEAVGHRVVHGGPYFSGSMLLGGDVLEKLKLCNDCAPLHTPPAIMGIEVSTHLPSLTAEMEEPLPMWQVTMRVPSVLPRILHISAETKR